MKKFLSALLCLTLLFSLPVWAEEPGADQPVESAPCTFPDMEDHWARDVVEKYVAMGVINGYGDGTFRPDELVTRAEAAKILTLTFGLEEPLYVRYTDPKWTTWFEYTDLKGTEWHYKYDISAAKYLSMNVEADWNHNAALLQPYEENFSNRGGQGHGTAGRFLPYANVTRYQLADTMVELLTKREGVEIQASASAESLFPNDPWPTTTASGQGLSEAQQRLTSRCVIAYDQGIMFGDDQGLFRPYDGMTRAEFLTTIDRILPRWEEHSADSPQAVDPPELEWYEGCPTEMYSNHQIIENELCYAYLGAMGGIPHGGPVYYISVVYKDGKTAQWQYSRGYELIKGAEVQSPHHSRIVFGDEPNILLAYGESGEKLAELDVEKQEVLWRYEHDRSKILGEDLPLPLTLANDGVFHDSPAGLTLSAGETVIFKTTLTPDDAAIWVRIRLSDGSQEVTAILPPGEYVTLTAPVDGHYEFQFMAPADGPEITGGTVHIREG